jgi:MFS family permease
LEPIKLELVLTDTQLGFLGGLAFAVFYTFLGIPIAMLADRRSRVKILAVAMVVWSVMTALCGLATNFVTLLLARIGVGAGEAGASPPSHSLISDYFPVEARATALSIYALGIPIGSMIGNFVGGWGADALGWRTTFFLVGLPGVLVALVIWFTLREPPRGMSDGIAVKTPQPADAAKADGPAAPSAGEVLKLLWGKRSFRHLSFAAGLHAFVSYGASTWNAPFFIRVHDMPITEVGGWLALVSGIGAIGTFLGGYWGDKLADRTGEKRWYFWVPGIATFIMVPFQLISYLYGGMTAVLSSLMFVAILSNMYLGPSFAMTQALGQFAYARSGLGDFVVCIEPHRYGSGALPSGCRQRLLNANIRPRVSALCTVPGCDGQRLGCGSLLSRRTTHAPRPNRYRKHEHQTGRTR